MEINSIAPLLSTRKLNSPKAMSKPPVFAEAGPVELGVVLMMVVAEVRTATLGGAVSMMVGLTTSISVSNEMVSMTVGTAMPTAVLMAVSMSILALVLMTVGDAESTVVADVELSNLVDAVRLVMVGEGAGESVDPDPVVPTVSAN
jgi:hypothetical protein